MISVDEIFTSCTSGPQSGEITAQNVSLYHSSPFSIYCEKYVSPDAKDPLNPYRELLFERGKAHEEAFIKKKYPECRLIEYQESLEGFYRLIMEMTSGNDVLIGMPLFYLRENLQGRFDVLVKKTNKPSIFGPYHYEVIEIKIAKQITNEHILQGAFYNYILSKLQGYLPEHFLIVNRDFEEHEFSFKSYESILKEAIKGTQAILDGTEIPTPTYNGAEWPWKTFTNHQALKTRDISLVGSVGSHMKEKLTQHGYRKVWDLSSANPDSLMKIPRIGESIANRLILNAKALTKNILIPQDLSVLDFPEKPVEIYLDLEGTDQPGHEDELAQMDYLIGVLVKWDSEVFYKAFFADRLSDEAEILRSFLRFMQDQKDFVIYHWHNYEKWHLNKMSEKYGLMETMKTAVFPHMIDLHRIATKAFVFPTYSNGLKDIAAWLGFKWRDTEINALDAIAYYLRYQNEPDRYRDRIESIIGYNEDDCRATKVIKDWLSSQKGKH